MEIGPLIEQMLEHKNNDEPRSETLARASLIKSGMMYAEALDLVHQGNALPPDDLNDLAALSTSFISEVSQCLQETPHGKHLVETH